MNKINFGFISTLEGGATCTGYVPDPKNSKSGVTIATGFDIGQRSNDDLRFMLPLNIAAKLCRYCGVKGEAALKLLNVNPVNITTTEAEIIDLCVKNIMVERLTQRYNEVSKVPFEMLPEQAKTVIASVAFQYGNLAKRCPKFWRFATTGNWLAMVEELKSFGDRYTTRRLKEAEYFIRESE